MMDLGYDREDLVSGVGEHLDKLESALIRVASEQDPSTDIIDFVETARGHIGPAMDAARAALDEAVLEQRTQAAERLGIEQRRIGLAKAALCRALKAMEGATVFITSRERRKHPEGTNLWLEDIEATRAAIAILSAAQSDTSICVDGSLSLYSQVPEMEWLREAYDILHLEIISDVVDNQESKLKRFVMAALKSRGLISSYLTAADRCTKQALR